MTFTVNNPTDEKIAQLVGLETYKALYTQWPSLYAYISSPLTPTYYFSSLVSGIVASSGLSLDVCGVTIKETLEVLSGLKVLSTGESGISSENFGISSQNLSLVMPLIDSSYKIENLTNSFGQNVIWIVVTAFLAFFIVWYLYAIGFWTMIFNYTDGISCYDCPSIFDRII